MPTHTHIQVTDSPSVRTVLLNRPDVHNAFDDSLIAELTSCFSDTAADSHIRVLILAGAGRSFCAGADLAWMRRMARFTREENLADARKAGRMFRALAECPQVTIARIQGAAMGGGAGLAAACDITVAADHAVFAFSEVRLGIAPSVIAPYVVRKIGPGRTRALFVTGSRFSAQEALRVGLVDRVVAGDRLDEAVRAVVADALLAGPNAVAATKRLLDDLPVLTGDEVEERTTATIADLRASDEGQEGLAAFLEKRDASFAVKEDGSAQ